MAQNQTQFRIRDVIRFGIYLLLGPALLFISSGRLDWWQAWVFIGVTYLAVIGGRLAAARRNPGLLQERAHSIEDTNSKSWDRWLAFIVGMAGPALVQLISGLDQRFQWSPELPLGVHLIGLAGLILGSAFSTWALIENRFFSAQVRIQKDRGHHVIDSGPYHIVRHPGYAGGLIATLAIPLLLNSLWAYLPSAVLLVVYFIRTSLEDRTLQAELPGYMQYAARTRYRLIPGIW